MSDSDYSLLRQYKDSATLFIVFGDARQIIIKKKQSFDFYKFFNENNINASVLYLNDRSARWYLGGIPHHTTDIESTVSFLKQEIIQSDAKKVITMGGSYGGYGAVLYGILMGVDKIIAFNPQLNLNIDPEQKITSSKLLTVPPHWLLGFYMLNILHRDKKQYFDLIELLKTSEVSCDLHYGTKFKATWLPAYHYDMTQMRTLQTLNLSNINIYQYNDLDHGSHHGIKYNGKLMEIINRDII